MLFLSLPTDWPSLVLLILGCLAAGGLFVYSVLRNKDKPLTMPAWAVKVGCALRQVLRRWSWFYLFIGGLALYPVQIYWQIRYAAHAAMHGDAYEAAAVAKAKLVDPNYVFSKLSIAIGVFCLINLLAWSALNLVIPVLPDWAKGRYADQDNAYLVGMPAPIVGFKRTFLSLSPLARIGMYFVGFGLQLVAAAIGVAAAFFIQ